MKYITKLMLAYIHHLCDVETKSTEFMIQYMQDVCNISIEEVNSYLSLSNEEQIKLREEAGSLLDLFIKLEETGLLK